jgi:hypothetical protein
VPDDFPIENAKEAKMAEEFFYALSRAASAAPGWMYDQSGLSEVLVRVEDALDRWYEREEAR